MRAYFERFTIVMTKAQAESASHQGQCDEDVKALSTVKEIKWQLDTLDPAELRAELKEYGAYSEEELQDHEQNKQRILWIAAGNIKEEMHEKERARR